jgi:hypothetical protein
MSKDNKSKGDKYTREDTPPPINVDKCTNITNALMGQQIIFTGITGQCTISPGNTQWPFNYGPNIVFPNLANPVIQIAQGLNTSRQTMSTNTWSVAVRRRAPPRRSPSPANTSY